jgi:hypothetical protein
VLVVDWVKVEVENWEGVVEDEEDEVVTVDELDAAVVELVEVAEMIAVGLKPSRNITIVTGMNDASITK